ncbi:MAG TPA: glycosyltransferase family 4 protein, partial [Terriglobales bacterium]|nr:glycosyltransferase family 4 protein [Terriglobales bacterium]
MLAELPPASTVPSLRIALVHLRQSGSGGTERHLNQLAAHLCEQRHQVTIVCRSFESAPHPAVRFVVLRSPVAGATWRMWAFAQAVERHLATAAYDVVVGLGKTWSQDVLRLGGGCHASYLERAHAQTRSGWERAIGRGWFKQRLALAIEARALRPGAYRRVIANSKMVQRDVMQRYAVPASRIEVIYNGVDTARFERRRHEQSARTLRLQCGFAESDVVVLFLGTGYGRKGLLRALRGFALAQREHRRLRLLCVGYDSDQRAYQYEAQRLGLAPVVRFLGG